ncbi:MAG: ABC transporter ATP-binding protein [Candidatus Taylorbacteria bacterium]|nr:ABC transporter ATP-binding protein [Candidatus Taylorbacteria bacterium]
MKPHTVRKIVRICLPFLPQFLVLGAATLLMPLMVIAAPYLYGRIADEFTKTGMVDYALAAMATAATLFAIVLRSVQTKENFKRIGYGLLERLDVAVLKKLCGLSLEQVTEGSERRREVIEKGELAVRGTISKIFTDILPIASLLFVTAVGLFFIHWLVASIVLLCLLCFIAVGIKIDWDIFERVKEYDREENRIGAEFWEKAANMRLIILTNQGKRAVDDYRSEYGKYARKGEELWLGHITRTLVQRDMFCFACMTLVLFISLRLMAKGEIEPSYFIVVMGWSYAAFDSMFSMGALQRSLMEEWSRIMALIEFFETPSLETAPESSIKIDSFEGLKIESASYRHLGSSFQRRAAIDNVSLEMSPGSITALVGPSGSGKTTIANMAIGAFRPRDGRVLVSGRDMRTLDMRSFWRFVGLVEQKPLFFSSMTIEENIDYALNGHAKDVPFEAKERLLRDIRLGDLCDSHRLGEPIDRVSGGERQRIAIARALMSNPKLLVLDEATSALDNENEAKVLEAIRKIAKERGITVLAIAHRYTTALLSDQVAFVKDGKVVAVGKHWDLMNKVPQYEALFFSEMLSQGEARS